MIDAMLKDQLSFKGKGAEATVRANKLESLGHELDRLETLMVKFTVEYKNLFNQNWQYYLYLRKHAGRCSLLWRKSGVNNVGRNAQSQQSFVAYGNDDFLAYRQDGQKVSDDDRELFNEFERCRLVLNYEFLKTHSEYAALRSLHREISSEFLN